MKRTAGLIFFSMCFSLVACSKIVPAAPSSPTAATVQSANEAIQAQVTAPGNVSAQPLPPITDNRPFDIDQPYAQANNVSIEEAARRLSLQTLIGGLGHRLTDNEAETFAGLWIQHTPDFRVVVLFTSRGNETMARYTPPELKGMVEVRSAETSLADLRAVQDNTTKSLESLGINSQSETDVYGNRVKFYVVDRTVIDSAIRDKRLVLSPKVDLVVVKTLGGWD